MEEKLKRVEEMLRIYRATEVPGLRGCAKDPNCLSKTEPAEYWTGRAEGMERLIDVLEAILKEK